MFLGKIIITPKASELIAHEEIQTALKRFSQNDWGEIKEDERLQNQQSIKTGRGYVVSRYVASNGREFVVFTLVERAFTGVLLSREYDGDPGGGLGWVC